MPVAKKYEKPLKPLRKGLGAVVGGAVGGFIGTAVGGPQAGARAAWSGGKAGYHFGEIPEDWAQFKEHSGWAKNVVTHTKDYKTPEKRWFGKGSAFEESRWRNFRSKKIEEEQQDILDRYHSDRWAGYELPLPPEAQQHPSYFETPEKEPYTPEDFQTPNRPIPPPRENYSPMEPPRKKRRIDDHTPPVPHPNGYGPHPKGQNWWSDYRWKRDFYTTYYNPWTRGKSYPKWHPLYNSANMYRVGAAQNARRKSRYKRKKRSKKSYKVSYKK